MALDHTKNSRQSLRFARSSSVTATVALILLWGPEDAPSIDLDARHAPVRYGYRRPGVWLVFPEVFRNDFCSGLDHKRVAETLLEHGMLERSKERWEKLQRIKEPGGDVKPKWFYWITDKILESDEGEISPTRVSEAARPAEAQFRLR